MHRLAGLCLVGTLVLPQLAHTQSIAGDTPADQIIVTGTRAPLEVQRLGNSATVISREDIERREVRNVAELLRAVPGFAVSQAGVSGSQTQIRVRGAEANHVLVLIDGVRANDPATGDEFRWEFLPTGNIERIEIVRGPQSSQWGSDAVAAVVHVITRDGRGTDGGRIGGYLEGGSNATLNTGLSGAYNTERWTLSAYLERLETDGENISRLGDERDGAVLDAAAVAGRLQASEAVDLHAGIRLTDAWSQYDPVDFVNTGLPADGDVASDTRSVSAQFGVDVDPTGSRLAHRFGIDYFDSDNRNRVAGSEDSSSAAERIGFSYQLDVELGDDRAAFAIEHETTDYQQRGATVFGDPNQDQRIDNSSVIAEYQAHGQRLTWIAGARYDRNSDFADALNARLALAFQVSEATRLHASIATGRKNPTFTELFGFFPAGHAGNPDLEAEHSLSFEAGVHRVFADGRLQLDAALFRQDLRDEINGFVFDPVTFLTRAENLPGKSRRSGAELALDWRIAASASLRGHYSYVDATTPDPAGSRVQEVRRPRHSGGIALDLGNSDGRLSATLNADYGGTRDDTFFPPFPAPATTLTLDSYWLLDLAIHYRLSDTVSVFARGSNLLDEAYEQVLGYRTPGRSMFFGVRFLADPGQ